MSVCTFIASNSPLREVMPQNENFWLRIFKDVQKYTNKKYGVSLEWYYTDGRAEMLLAYIKNALQHEKSIELWHVWLADYYEYEDSPVIQRCTIPFSDMTIEDIKEIDNVEIWNKPDKRYPERPSFYCLEITR